MTTISIKSSESLAKTQFENLSELREYLAIQQLTNPIKFNVEELEEFNSRYQEMVQNEFLGISVEEVKAKYFNSNK